MRFESEGIKNVIIRDAGLLESKIPSKEGVFDVGLLVEDPVTRESDWWRGEISKDHGPGKLATKQWWEITLDSLNKIGWKHGTSFLTENLQSLIGKETTVKVASREYEGVTYYAPQILAPWAPRKPSATEEAEMLKKMFGFDAVPAAATSAAAVGAEAFGPAAQVNPAASGQPKYNPFNPKSPQ